MPWRPLSQRGGADSGYDALYEGIPPWLTGSLIEWVQPFFSYHDHRGSQVISVDRIREVERRLRIPMSGSLRSELYNSLLYYLRNDEQVLLDVVDLGASWAIEEWQDTEMLEALDRVLLQGGSAWRLAVHDGTAGLQRRVDETVTSAARSVMSASGRAGEYLAQAWNEVYGRDPSAGEAYRHAVRAVEVAAIPVVIPSDSTATLGKAIAALRDAPDNWTVALSPTDGSNAVDFVRRMCELLWKSQWDRHGVLDESVALNVSQEEAEAAVHLATTLVQWFTGGTVERC